MMNDDFYGTLCEALGVAPTPWRRSFFDEWARWEGTGARFNPLATTQPGGEDEADPYWNTFGDRGQYHVRNYGSLAAGVAATAATLRNGFYPLVMSSIAAERLYAGVSGQIRTWGTSGFATAIDGGWQPAGPDQPGTEALPPAESPGAPPLPPGLGAAGARLDALEAYVDRLNAATLARFAAVKRAFDQLVEGFTLALAEVDGIAAAAADADHVPKE